MSTAPASSAASCKKDWLIAFEDRIRAHWESGALPCLLHLCGGNEDQLIEIFSAIRPEDWVFSTHRNHYHALLKGVPAERLEADILAGRSMFTFSREHNFYSTAILAGQCAIAAGVAWALKQSVRSIPSIRSTPHVWCFLGDGAEEEGHFYEAVVFSHAHDLPITFIIEDNNRQVDTPKPERRGDTSGKQWQNHFPLYTYPCVSRYHYTPTYPHAGSGAKAGTITFQPEAIAHLRG